MPPAVALRGSRKPVRANSPFLIYYFEGCARARFFFFASIRFPFFSYSLVCLALLFYCRTSLAFQRGKCTSAGTRYERATCKGPILNFPFILQLLFLIDRHNLTAE
jgi:hypothetical protein